MCFRVMIVMFWILFVRKYVVSYVALNKNIYMEQKNIYMNDVQLVKNNLGKSQPRAETQKTYLSDSCILAHSVLLPTEMRPRDTRY